MRKESGKRCKKSLFVLPSLSPPLMGSYKDRLNVMMCKMRKMSPLVKGGGRGVDGKQPFEDLMCLILGETEWVSLSSGMR